MARDLGRWLARGHAGLLGTSAGVSSGRATPDPPQWLPASACSRWPGPALGQLRAANHAGVLSLGTGHMRSLTGGCWER